MSVRRDLSLGCHSEEFQWAFGPPEPMKVERKTFAMENGVTCEKQNKLSAFSPRDFRGSRWRRGSSHCAWNAQSKIPRFARNDSLNEVLTQTL